MPTQTKNLKIHSQKKKKTHELAATKLEWKKKERTKKQRTVIARFCICINENHVTVYFNIDKRRYKNKKERKKRLIKSAYANDELLLIYIGVSVVQSVQPTTRRKRFSRTDIFVLSK